MAQMPGLELFPGAGAAGIGEERDWGRDHALPTHESSWHPGHFRFQRKLSFPCPNYLQEEQCLLFCPLSSGTGRSFTLQEIWVCQREEPVTTGG